WSWRPQEGPQYALIICPPKEIFFGGTRGGGKADARSASNQHLASFKRQDCTLVAWYRSIYAPRTGGVYDSHHRTAGVSGWTRRRGGVMAARGACAAAQGADNRGSRGRGLRFGAILAAVS